MIYTVTLNPAIDKTVQIDGFTVNAVNRIHTLRTDPGGKGINVSKVIAALGGESTATGLVAGRSGAFIENALTSLGIPHSFLTIPGETRTNLKIVDPVLHTNTDVNEPGPAVTPEILEAMLGHLLSLAQPGDTVTLSGSLPKDAPAALYAHWTQALRANNITVFLDADGEALKLALEARPSVVKPNREELSHLLGRPLDTIDSLSDAARDLLSQDIETVVISLGADGALFAGQYGIWLAEGLPVTVNSTVGAGDSMVAALALSRERGYDMETAIRLTMATSAASVTTPGTQPPTYDQIHPLLPRVRFHSYREI